MTTSNSETCSITVWLAIETSTYNIEQISEQLGLHADASHRMGEPRGATGKLWESNIWRLREYCEVSWEGHYEAIGDTVKRLLHRVEPVAERFRALSRHTSGQLLIGTVSKEVPGIHLDAEILQQIARLGVDIEIDILGVENDCGNDH